MTHCRSLLVSLVLLLCVVTHSSAQDVLSRAELGFTVGGMNYIGDLNKQSMFGQVNLGAGLLGRYNLSDRWALAFTASYGRLAGGNPDVDALRNLSFRSDIWEGALRAEFNFVSFGFSGISLHTTPFLFCGFGVFHFNPQARYSNPLSGEQSWVDLQPLHTEGQGLDAYPGRNPYPLFEVMFPFGFGFKMALSKSVSLVLEYGFRKTWTDYIDDVSTTYVGEEALGYGSLAAALADRSGEVQSGYVNAVGIQRGDASLDDWYAYFNFSLAFNLNTLFGWMKSKTCDIK